LPKPAKHPHQNGDKTRHNGGFYHFSHVVQKMAKLPVDKIKKRKYYKYGNYIFKKGGLNKEQPSLQAVQHRHQIRFDERRKFVKTIFVQFAG